MKISLLQHEWLQFIVDYLDFNNISYRSIDHQLSPNETFDLCFNQHESNQLLILSVDALAVFTNWTPWLNRIIDWINNGNKIIVSRDGDAFLWFDLWNSTSIKLLDKAIPKNSIVLMLHCKLSDRYWINHLENFKKVYFPTIHSPMVHGFNNQTPRIRGSVTKKKDNSRDFMLTMIKRPGRPHRKVLWDELQFRKGLLEHGNVIYRRFGDPWFGHDPGIENWVDGIPSMDLYNNSWLEIVPETCYKNVYFITEKTIKPMGTFTPFLMLSNAKFLEYLKQLGFQTFHGIIDEKYDTEYRVQDRARLLVDQLEDICRNGARSFYEACHDRLIYNFNRLAEIQGSWQFHMDSFIHETLESVVDQKMK